MTGFEGQAGEEEKRRNGTIDEVEMFIEFLCSP